VTLVLDARTLKRLQTLSCPDAVTRLAFAPDSKSLLTVGNRLNADSATTTEMRLWDARTGSLRAKWYRSTAPALFSVASGGRFVALGNVPKPGYVRTLDLRTGRIAREWKAQDRNLDRIVLSPDGSRLFAFSWGYPPTIWDTVEGGRVTDIPELRGWQAPETIFSPDGKLLATSGLNNDARLWNTGTGRLAADLRGQLGKTDSFALAPDGETVAAGCEDEAVRLWQLRAGRLRATLPCRMAVHAVAFAPNGSLLAAAAGNFPDEGRLCLWDPQTGKPQADISLKHAGYALAFSPDSRLLALSGMSQASHGERFPDGYSFYPQATFSGGNFRGGDLWNIAEGMRRTTLSDQPNQIALFAFSQDSRLLATGSDSASGDPRFGSAEVRLRDVSADRPEVALKALGSDVLALAYAPDGRTLATGSHGVGREPRGRLWDVASGKAKAALEATREDARAPVVALAYSPDGHLLAGSVAGKVQVWDAASGRLTATLDEPRDFVTALAFSPDGRLLATTGEEHRTRLWDVAARRQIPIQRWEQLAVFPAQFRVPLSTEGAALLVHDPRDGRVLARLIHIPSSSGSTPTGTPSPKTVASPDEWFTVTPEGYFDGSPDAAHYIKWNVDGILYPAERYLRRFRRPDLVHRALQGEKIQAPAMTVGDVPPSVRIVGLKDGDRAASDPLKVTVEAQGLRRVKQVEIYVNGRPLSPGEARPIEADARPIEADARHLGAPARFLLRSSFRVSLPQGAAEIHLRVVAYDETDLGSDPVEIVLHRAGVQEVTGNLYVLSVGVGRYRNGGGKEGGSRGQFSNLRYPSADAQAIAARFQQEGRPLYERVEVRSLLDAQATLSSIRDGLRWLQESVGPGQIDTAVIYLSGHGYSTAEGRYYFAPYDFDVGSIEKTGLAGSELREALGGRLRARRVFLFVDTCHSGGLGGRNEDLAATLGDGVFVVASSGATEYAYESEAWGHGAFTLGLLRSLERKELEDSGAIRFADLVSSLRREVASLLRQSGRSDTEQEPCVPLSGRRLGEPVARAHP
jgi:WD40 repeat protein